MVKSGKSFVKIESRFQIALSFLFYWNFQPPAPLIPIPDPLSRLFDFTQCSNSPSSRDPRVGVQARKARINYG